MKEPAPKTNYQEAHAFVARQHRQYFEEHKDKMQPFHAVAVSQRLRAFRGLEVSLLRTIREELKGKE